MLRGRELGLQHVGRRSRHSSTSDKGAKRQDPGSPGFTITEQVARGEDKPAKETGRWDRGGSVWGRTAPTACFRMETGQDGHPWEGHASRS